MFDSRESILDLYRKYSQEVFGPRLMAIKMFENGDPDGGISHVDGELFYMLLRELQPKHPIEFSPCNGYSTAFLAEAIRINNNAATLYTFDKQDWGLFDQRMTRVGVSPVRILGNAIEEIPRFINNNNLNGLIDFCFIDSDHGADFARNYITNILPLFSPTCVLVIHDMASKNNITHYGFASTDEIIGTRSAIEEANVLKEQLLPNYNIISTHQMFGDWHEDSPRLPRNLDLINSIKCISSFFILEPTQSTGNDIPRPPMSIILYSK